MISNTIIDIPNPVLPGFHPDPSMIRVGNDYYLAVSTFEWFPGVRIYHSSDLINWEYITAVLDSFDMADLRGICASDGIWAPCLSYSDGFFYLIYSIIHGARSYPVMEVSNYLTRANEITGPWSKPVYLNSSGFDPSLFHDDDGRKWLLNMEWDYRKVSDGNPFSGILIQEYDPLTETLIGTPKKIFSGTPIGSLEGPHIYKRNGYYYLFCAEGGTGWLHAATVARSLSLNGPYEVHPNNPLLTSQDVSSDDMIPLNERTTPELGKAYLKKAGHASLCDTPDGSWYIAHLCSRPVPKTACCVMGRETAIQQIVWKNDWPYLAGGGKHPMNSYPINSAKSPRNIQEKTSAMKLYTFYDKDFIKDFQTLRTPFDDDTFSIRERQGYLRIYGKESIFSRFNQALLARRQSDFCFKAETSFIFRPDSFQQSAGLIYRYDEANQYYLYATFDEESRTSAIGLSSVNQGCYKRLSYQILSGDNFTFSLVVRERTAQFSYSANDACVPIGPLLDSTILSDDYADGFTGAFIGICVQDLQSMKQYADFKSFLYKSLP